MASRRMRSTDTGVIITRFALFKITCILASQISYTFVFFVDKSDASATSSSSVIVSTTTAYLSIASSGIASSAIADSESAIEPHMLSTVD